MNRNTLGRSERLKSEKAIGELFEKGSSFSLHPIRMIYRFNSSTESIPVKSGFVVPKKNFKKAIDRNLLKRRMRESYRLNKNILTRDNTGKITGVEIMLVYQGQKAEDYELICNCIKELLKKLALKMKKNQEKSIED